MKILILKPSSLGDVVQALPVLRLLKLYQPASEIFWWLDAGLVPLLQGDPDLAGIFAFNRDRWAAPKHWWEIWGSICAMRRQQFDWVIDLQGLMRSGVFAWLANGQFTIGVEDGREGAHGYYDVAVPRPLPNTHAADWYLAVLTRLGVPVHGQFNWLPERPEIAARVQMKWNTNSARWLALLPGARWENKRWPAEYFAELVQRFSAQIDPDLRFAILGGIEDVEPAKKIAAVNPSRCLNLAGQTSLPEMVEWLRLSRMVITNDTGPMHVAAALGKPIVALFGPTEPKRTGPYGQIDRTIQARHLSCVPCLKGRCTYAKPIECLRAILPGMVFEVAQQRMAETTDRGLSQQDSISSELNLTSPNR